VLGTPAQAALVLALGAGLPVLFLFLARPHVAFGAYLLVLPLLLGRPLVAGLNGGELLTMAALVLGVASLWQVQGRLGASVRALRAIVLPLIGLAVVGLLSLIANGITAFGEILDGLFKVLAFAIMAVLVHVHASTERRAMMMLRCIVAGGILVALYAVVAYLLGWSYSEEYDWNRASGTFEDWNVLGGFMVLMSATTLGLAATARSAGTRLLLISASVLQIAAMLLSLTLGSLVALVAGAVLGLALVMRVGWGRLAAAATVFGIGFAMVLLTNETLRDKLTRIDERTVDRLRGYAVGVSMFRDKFLLGFGTQSEILNALWYGEADYGLTAFGASSSVPHNSLLLIGVEKGFLGVILFALLIVGALRLMFRQRAVFARSGHALLYAGVMVSVLGFLVQNLVNNLVLHARVGIVFFALIAVMTRVAEFAHGRAESDGSIP
jgi:O-antigen ligase